MHSMQPIRLLFTAACALLLFCPHLEGIVSAQQLQEPRDCTASAQSYGANKSASVASLAVFDAFSTEKGQYSYPDAAAQYDLSRTCCPEGSFIVEWEVVLKTFLAPQPFDDFDGRNRSLNGTVLPDNYVADNLRSLGSYATGYNNYRSWNSSGVVTWDDIQGIALPTLHNKTILGSLQAKCGLSNGTIVAELPKIGANKTSDCLDAPGLKILESQPIRVINSQTSAGIFTGFFYDNHFKLPRNLNSASEAISNLSRLPGYYRGQDSPYQDWMGLMKLLEYLDLSVETAPAVIDIATLDWSDEPVSLSSGFNIGLDYSRNESYRPITSGWAAAGFTGLAGCFGPVEVQVFNDRLYLDTPPTPEVSSYANCSYNASDQHTYGLFGPFILDPFYSLSRFRSRPLVCCPEGQYVQELALQFRGDRGFSNPDKDGVFRKRLWSFAGICSRGTKLPEISAGNGCTGSSSLLPPENFTLRIAYDSYESAYTNITYGADGGGILGVAGMGPNSSLVHFYGSNFLLGGFNDYGTYYNPAGKRLRIVGMDAMAGCDGIYAIGMISRTQAQVNEPAGGLSRGAIAGIVIGAVASVALVAAVFMLHRRRGASKGFSRAPIP